ncbi:precorrin-6y C5,15-methyltransferase (decarboxylating) subunit CbiE [Anoxynatronum sibiricum]|uniref:Precorrin-6y C5,15-methyltransferase (Decarboxylating) subunit CbiE n=1 Tax=Anoxynatronum sibiricum TaxID=210623 RepID=A0ABU9VVS6_9CLOT
MTNHNRQHSPLQVVGMGPGHPRYLLPEARETIENCQVLAGAPRLVAPYEKGPWELIPLKGPVTDFLKQVADRRQASDTPAVAVLVSGDPGFHSLLPRLTSHFGPEKLRVVPGISSLQLFCSRLGLSWSEGRCLSLHGRQTDWQTALRQHSFICLLTDPQQGPEQLAAALQEMTSLASSSDLPEAEVLKTSADLHHPAVSSDSPAPQKADYQVMMAVGQRLSYDDERIFLGSPAAIAAGGPYSLNVVVISCDQAIIRHLQHLPWYPSNA